MATALAALTNQASAHVGAGVVPQRLGNRHPSIAPYQTFRAADGFFVVACGNDSQFGKVAAAIGRPDLALDERFTTNTKRVANIDALEPLLGEAFSTASVTEWVATLSAQGVPAGPINDIGQAFVAAEELGVAPVVTTTIDGESQRSVRSPILLSATPMTVRRNPPALGQDDDQVRTWLGTARDAAGELGSPE